MRVLYLVNDRTDVRPHQTTAALSLESARRFGASWLAGVDDITLGESGTLRFQAMELRVGRGMTQTPEAALGRAYGEAPVTLSDNELDVLMFRTNPGRDRGREALHDASLSLGRIGMQRGLRVLNAPDALARCSDKLFLASLPETLRPRMLVSRVPSELRQFVERANKPTVLKPLNGTQGRNVFRVRGGGPNLGALIELLTQEGFVIAQEYLRKASEGDRRVILVDGVPLTVNGHVCGVRRVPRVEGEFRSNIHLGGEAMPLNASAAILKASAAIGEHLREHGVWMAGVDLVGAKAVEVNVRSPGGLTDAAAFEGQDFVGALLDTVSR